MRGTFRRLCLRTFERFLGKKTIFLTHPNYYIIIGTSGTRRDAQIHVGSSNRENV